MIVSRLAPTPSGYLHAGNAINMILTAQYVTNHNGKLLLRIDDADSARSKPAYVDNIFATLDWLEIAHSGGPRDAQDLAHRYSQVGRRETYYAAVEQLLAQEKAYGCVCSRKQAHQWQSAGAHHACRDRDVGFLPGETVRFRAPQSGAFTENHPLGDFVLWRRDDLPAYQLVSVIEDQSLGVNTIVRGSDLAESSQAQRTLAAALGAEQVTAARFFHHPLISGPDGNKLAKSNAAPPLRGPDAPGKTELHDIAASLYERTFCGSAQYRAGEADNLRPVERPR